MQLIGGKQAICLVPVILHALVFVSDHLSLTYHSTRQLNGNVALMVVQCNLACLLTSEWPEHCRGQRRSVWHPAPLKPSAHTQVGGGQRPNLKSED